MVRISNNNSALQNLIEIVILIFNNVGIREKFKLEISN